MNATLPGSSLKDFSRILSCFSKVSDEVNLEVKPGKVSGTFFVSAVLTSPGVSLTKLFVVVVVHVERVQIGIHSHYFECDAV